MLKRLICALAALLLVIPGASAGGVTEVSKEYGPIRTEIALKRQGDKIIYELTGRIDPGAERILERLAGEREGGWLVLNSEGGDEYSSMSIGRIAHRLKLKTYVAPNSLCLSGCAVIWAGGHERWVARGGVLGFHSPWYVRDGKAYDGDPRRLAAYYKELKIRPDAINRLLAPSSTFYYLTEHDAKQLGIDSRWND